MAHDTTSRTWDVSRRSFLAAGTTAAAASLVGCDRIRRFLRSSPAPSAAVKERRNAVDVFSICDNCVNKCGLRAQVVAGRLVKLDPNPYFPKSRSMLCAKGNAGVAVLHDPDRLKHPLIRVGERFQFDGSLSLIIHHLAHSC